MKTFLLIFLFSSSLFAQSQFRYEGYLENGGAPVGPLTGQTFEVRVKKPGCASLLGLPAFVDNNVSIQNGEFNLVPQFDSDLLSLAMDPNQPFGCASGSARDLEITWVNEARTFLVSMQEAPRASFSNLAGNSQSLSGRTQTQFLRIDDFATQTPLTNAQVNSLVNLVNGTSALYSTPASPLGGDLAGSITAATVQAIRGRPVAASAAAPAAGQVLKYDGSNWAPAADETSTAPGDASYAAKGVVRFDSSSAVSGISVTAGVARLASSGVAANNYGNLSNVPAITVDNMGRITAASNTPIGIDASQVTAGILTVARGGTGMTSFTPNALIAANAVGTALVNVTCNPNEILKWSGTAWSCSMDLAGGGGGLGGSPSEGQTLNGYIYTLWPQSFASRTGIGASGTLTRSNATPVESPTTRFRIQIRTPGPENCLLWEEEQTRNMMSSGGSYRFDIGDSANAAISYTRIDTYPWGLERVFSNRSNFSALTACAIGNSYNPNATDGRVLEISFKEAPTDPTWEALGAVSIRSVNLNSLQLEGFRANEFLKIAPFTNQSPLSNAEVNNLISLSNGTSTTYLQKAGDMMTGALDMNSQNISNAAVISTDVLTNNILALKDDDLNVAMLQAPNNLASNYTLTLPLALPSNGQVLSSNAAGQMSWITPTTSIAVTAPVQSSGGSTPTISLNTGLGTSQVPMVGGAALSANGVVLANGLGTALASLNCSMGQVIKFNVSGFAECAADMTGLTSLNGQSGQAQTFVAGNSGTAPNISSTANIHTFNIPLASTAGVISGTISKVDYDNFMNKPAFNNSGTSNLFLGVFAGQSNSTGARNTSLGDQTLRSSTTGNDNTAIGFESGLNITTSFQNTLHGIGTGRSLASMSANSNTFIGYHAGRDLNTGNQNTFIGHRAGSQMTNGNANTFIGGNDGAALGLINNSVVLSDGNGDIKLFADFQGRVGIGTENPAGLLHTKSNGANELFVDSYDNTSINSSFFVSRRSRGSTAAGSSVLLGDRLGGWGAVGNDQNTSIITNQITAGIYATAAENFTPTNRGTSLSLFTTPNGNSTRLDRVKILENGNVGIGTISPAATLDVNGTVRLGAGSATLSRVIKCNPTFTVTDSAIPAGSVTPRTGSCPGVTAGMIMQCNFVSHLNPSPLIYTPFVISGTDEGTGVMRVQFLNPTAVAQPVSGNGTYTLNLACIGFN